MGKTILRGLLVFLLAIGLCGLHAPTPVLAVTLSPWTNHPPQIDGVATMSEWGGAAYLNYTHYSVRFQNDDQFLYVLFDVTAETYNSPIGPSEFFFVKVDRDNNGVMDALYSWNPNTSYLQRQTSTNGIGWVAATCQSYGAVGFGPTPASATPHRVYEMALRLSEMNVLPANNLKISFEVSSINPAFDEASGLATLHLYPPTALYLYDASDPNGLTDAATFQSILNADGLGSSVVTLANAASLDLSVFQVILIGADTGTAPPGSTWAGSSALVEKIRQSKVPVIGIGAGGLAFFKALGLYLGTNAMSDNGWAVSPGSPTHPAWSVPSAITLVTPLNITQTGVTRYAISAIAHGFPVKTMTLIAANDNDTTLFPVIAQNANGACYTLWGFSGSPSILYPDAKKLLGNLAWQPPCRPAVLYLKGSDTTLTNSMIGLLDSGGFPFQTAFASSAASADFSSVQRIMVGWDTASAWATPANVNAVVNSHLPVVAMGEGGDNFLYYASVPMAFNIIGSTGPLTGATLVDPLRPILRNPYPVGVPSSRAGSFDTSGVSTYFVRITNPYDGISIAYDPSAPYNMPLATQSFKNTCYEFYGFNSYWVYMTDIGKGVLLNMLAEPMCSYPAFLPMVMR